MADKFRELYTKLNSEQKEAVDTIEGPVMVIAGPGTGKTQVLTLRIANILLKTQINPGNILALTFTENGVVEMRQRLVNIIGRPAYQVRISTFHGFCNDLIQTYPEEFGDILGRKPATEVEQIDILKQIFDRSRLEMLKPFGDPYFYLREGRRAISQLKREGISPEGFSALMEKEAWQFSAIDDLHYDSGKYRGKMKGKYADWKKQIDKNFELAKIYDAYQQLLAEAKRYDYDDMVLEAVKALQGKADFLLRLQERWQYFLVDEHQDTNNAQNKVLELLSNFFANPNLFVVGDEKQAIFRFQGASLENFLYFKKLYPQAKLVTLKNNYRSTQPILDLAQNFIINNQRKISDVMGGVSENLVSVSAHPPNLAEIYEFKQGEAEYYFVARQISRLLSLEAAPQEIAVIYRDNRDAFEVGNMLEKHGIPFRVESGENILADADIRQFVAVLRYLHDFSSEEKLFALLSFSFFQIPALDVYKLINDKNRRGTSLLELFNQEKRLIEMGVEQVERIIALGHHLLRWQSMAQNDTLLTLFETVVRESGFLAHLLGHQNSALGLARLEALFREMKKLIANHPQTTLADFIRYLDSIEEHEVGIKTGRPVYIPQAVRLMTAHGAKGLEFDYVFVINCHDGHWGNRRIPQLIKLPRLSHYDISIYHSGDGLKNDDERRLFYVAVTRARKMVYLSYALSRLDQRAQYPSQFLEEIKPELKKTGLAGDYERDFEANRSSLYSAPKNRGWSVFEKEYLNALFYKRGLSATALNNYLNCPWKYFYLNLLKIPRAKSKAQMYGTAVHAALKDFFNAAKKTIPTLDFLLERFQTALQEEPLMALEREQVLAKGRQRLAAYYHFYRNTFNDRLTLNEFKIRGVVLEVGDKQIHLSGSLDKIEYLSGGREVNVVDYKTGQPQTRNKLEGKTKHATGDYRRQLVFYKLLLDESPTFPGTMVSGEIDFVEPDKAGKFHKERFTIEPEEVTNLKELLLKIADDILNLGFWENRCGEKNCEFCQLRYGS